MSARPDEVRPAWGQKIGVSAFAVLVGIGLAANMLTGVDWNGIRAEFDRFAEAFWRQGEAVAVAAETAKARADRPDRENSERDASPREINLGGIRLPDIRIGDVKLPRLFIGDREAVANYVRFDRVAFAQGVLVTGREYRENRRGEKPYRQYCYAERAPPADGVKVWVSVATQLGASSPEYMPINDQQAAAMGVEPAQLAKLARELCRLVEGQADGVGTKE
jgi:hypothetical protein